MTLHTVIELIGYFGSLLVIVSMLMTSVVKLRIINSIGCVIFATYALIIHSYPTAAMQICLIVINAINLHKLLNTQNEYSVARLEPNESFLKHFLDENATDIGKYFPNVQAGVSSNCAYLVECGASNAGVILGTLTDGVFTVQIDYTIPMYRDCSVGKYLYAYLAGTGVKKLVAEAMCPAHRNYLLKMGFAETDGKFLKML